MREKGFSLVELLIATAIATATFGVVLQLLTAAQRVARAQPAAADMYQTLRVAADMLQRDLVMAGAGLAHGAVAGPLVNYLPPIMPMRTGARMADPELSFFSDRISILYVPGAALAVPLSADMAAAGHDVPVSPAAVGCPPAGLCGFTDGTRALILDTADAGRGFDLFSVSGTAGALAHGAPDPNFSRAYRRDTARVVPIKQRVYHLDAGTRRLMVYDGSETDVPLADNIVALTFEYFVDPWPASVPRPADASGNCLFAATVPPASRLADLGSSSIFPASGALLTDGPVCGLAPHRFDGDLLRIRRVRVTIRAEVADSSLRGTGPAFLRPGRSPGGESSVADLAVTFDVTPRNMQPTR